MTDGRRLDGAGTTAERYLVLGLRLGKHVDGLVDAYYGPAELKRQVDAEGTIPPAQLAADADSLLDELSDGWLADQVRGCATYAWVSNWKTSATEPFQI